MAGGHRPPPPKGGDTVSTVPAARGPGRWRWGYPARPGLAGPGGWHRSRPHGGPGAVAELTSPAACQLCRGSASGVVRRGWVPPSPASRPASAPSGLSPKDTRNSEQCRASNQRESSKASRTNSTG